MNYTGCRAIIIKDNKIALMERWFAGEHYFVLPGGRIEQNEELKECVIRELKEEFNIDIKPIKLVYDLLNNKNQAIFFSEWIGGEIGKTDAEEYQPNALGGIFEPRLVDLNEIENINLVPKELKEQLLIDLKQGSLLNKEKVIIHCPPR